VHYWRVLISALWIKLASDGDASSKRIPGFYTWNIALTKREEPTTSEITSFVTITTPLLLHLFLRHLCVLSVTFPGNLNDLICIKL
jgi:hypothetical protein